MKVTTIVPKCRGNFLNLHHYHLDDGRIYEVCSRRARPDPKRCDAVDIIAFNATKDAVCVISEYRPPVEGNIVAFPAGLREAEEEISETAQRELFEECGLHIAALLNYLEPSFQSPGMSDETCATVFCVAEGELTNENATKDEVIHPMWFTKEQAREYLKSGQPISARCQMFLAMWSGYFN